MLEIPVDQRVKGRIAEKAKTLAAIAGDAAGCRNVGGGHGDPHDLVGVRRANWRSSEHQRGDKTDAAQTDGRLHGWQASLFGCIQSGKINATLSVGVLKKLIRPRS